MSLLYGRLTFNFHFTGGTGTVFTEVVNFSATDLEDDGSLVGFLQDGRLIICSAMPSGTYRFLCISWFDLSGDSDNFLFNVSNGNVSGVYEFCLGTQSSTQCANDLVSTPDGPLSGTVTKLGSLPAADGPRRLPQQVLAERLAEKHGLPPAASPAPDDAARRLAQQLERMGQAAARATADPQRQRP